MNASLLRRAGPSALLLLALLVAAQLLSAPPAARADGVARPDLFALTAPGKAQGNNILYVLDGRAMRLLVFEHTAGDKLRLTHVRELDLDVQLAEVGAQDPAAEAVEAALEKQRKRKKG